MDPYPLVKFGDVVRQVKDKVDPQTAGLERYLAGEHMDTDNLHIRRWGNIGDGYLGPAFHMRFKPGQVLYGSRRTYLRKVAVADFEGITANTTYVIESRDPDVLLPDFLPFVMSTERFHEHSIKQSKGSVNPYINFSDITWYEFPLPPVDEQRRIADLLWAADETYHAHIDAREKLEVTKTSKVIDLLEQPVRGNSCDYVLVEELGNGNTPVLKTGPFGSSLKSEYFSSSGVPVLNISAVGDVDVQHEGLFYLPYDKAQRFDAYRLVENDIVFSRVAEIGRCILITKECDGWIISSNLIRIRLDKQKVNPNYFLYLLKYSPYVQKQIRQATTGGGRMLVNTKTLGKITYPIPSKSFQEEVVQDIQAFDERISLMDEHIEIIKKLGLELREQLVGRK
jgi:type I restriction enzyme S subunit